MVGALCVSMTGCSFKNTLRSWLTEGDNGGNNGGTNTETWRFNNDDDNKQYSYEVEKAYEFFKNSAKQYETDNKKFVKDENGVGFVETVTQETYDSFRVNKESVKTLVSDMVDVSKNVKEQLDSIQCNVDMFYKVIIDGEVKIEIRNGQIIKFDLGDTSLEQQIKDELMNGNSGNSTTNNNNAISGEKESTTEEKKEEKSLTCYYCGKSYKKSNSGATTKSKYCSSNCEKKHKESQNKKEKSLTCKQCGKSYKKSKSDAAEPNKYCSSGCYTDAAMLEKKRKEEEADKKAKRYYCIDCGTEIDKEQYNNWQRCSYCAKVYDNKTKEDTHHCLYCGKCFNPSESGSEDFCSEICAVNYEGEQFEEWESHHGYDENGRLIPCQDHCGDGCDSL